MIISNDIHITLSLRTFYRIRDISQVRIKIYRLAIRNLNVFHCSHGD